MVDPKTVHKQLKKLKFGSSPWNQAELRELPHILHEHENISELVNGIYEGGIALLVATDQRLLLIDKKPLNYLTVEDLRFDMINEIDYSHRLVGATITIATGSKNLTFKSYNQSRLRHLINLLQERMSMVKKEQSDKADTQQQHLEEINKQLQMYLLAQHQHLQQQIMNQQQQTAAQAAPVEDPTAPKPSPQLADYLFAQRLMEKFQQDNPDHAAQVAAQTQPVSRDMVAEAKQEIFASRGPAQQGIEISPLRIAYAKLPMALRNKRFGHHFIEQRPEVAIRQQPAV